VHVELSEKYETPNDSWEFLQVVTATGEKYRYIALGSIPTAQMRTLVPKDRQIFLPKTGVIHKLQGPTHMKRAKTIHIQGSYEPKMRGGCEVLDMQKMNACGFLESPEFMGQQNFSDGQSQQ